MSMLDRTHGQDDNGYFQALLEGNGHRYHQAAALAAAAGTNCHFFSLVFIFSGP